MKKISIRSLFVFAILFCSVLAYGPVQAQQQPSYAILIVGDEDNAEMIRQEKVLIGEMAKMIRKQSTDMRLKIFSYHFNKQRERAYCEAKLNVLSEDLLFVGIVRLDEKRVPIKVVYRVDRINNPARAAKDIISRGEELVAESRPQVTETPQASPSPNVSETPDPGETPTETNTDEGEIEARTGPGFRVQLGSFAQLKFAQDKVSEVKRSELDVSIVEVEGPDGDTLYKVLSPLVKARSDADELLSKFKEAGFEEAFLTRVGGE